MPRSKTSQRPVKVEYLKSGDIKIGHVTLRTNEAGQVIGGSYARENHLQKVIQGEMTSAEYAGQISYSVACERVAQEIRGRSKTQDKGRFSFLRNLVKF